MLILPYRIFLRLCVFVRLVLGGILPRSPALSCWTLTVMPLPYFHFFPIIGILSRFMSLYRRLIEKWIGRMTE